MTKFEIIDELKGAGVFELTQEIIDAIDADFDPDHASANRDIRGMIDRIHQMTEWTQFSARTMLDLATQAFGFAKYAFYSDLDICADVMEDLEDLHDILWQRLLKVWKE